MEQTHTDEADTPLCGGLQGRCPDCIALYKLVLGETDVVPSCVACGFDHWPWDAHGADGPAS